MAAPGKPSSSRWGSFISQAVAGVESRLDNMLTEGEEAERLRQLQASQKPVAATKPAPQPAQPAANPAPAPSKPSSRANDRLQARLAKAVAARNAQAAGASPRSSVDQPSPTSSARASIDKGPSSGTETPPTKETTKATESKPATPELSTTPAPDVSASSENADVIVKQEPPKQSIPELAPKSAPEPLVNDEPASEVTPKPEVSPDTNPDPKSESQPEPVAQNQELEKRDSPKEDTKKQDFQKEKPKTTKKKGFQEQKSKKQDTLKEDTKKNDVLNQEPKKEDTPNKGIGKQDAQNQEATKPVPAPASPTEGQADTSQTSEEFEAIKARQQEEIQEYVERIDALQAKLQYLSKNAAEAAKKSKAAAPSGSVERKLAEKDEKIALLMEEGRKLSTSEQKFRTVIRKLRVQLTDNEKQLDELKRGKEKAAAEAEAIRDSMNTNEEQEKLNEEVRKVSAALQKEIDALKKDNAAKDANYKRLQQDSKSSAEQAELASAEILNKALAAERAMQKELEDTISSLETENETLSNKARLDTLEWQEKLDRATDRNRNVEEELKLELLASESKLEAMRAAAEEASSGFGGESQIKLIRQIETLQSQYASASDNWQGIEASLLTKVSNLEKERDEAVRRESEMRKKARDSASRCRRLEDELQDVTPALSTAQQELETCREQLAALRVQSKSTETALEQARADLEKQQRSVTKDFAVEAERRQWADDVAGSMLRNQSRPESPLLSVPRTFSSDLIGLPVPGRTPRRTPTPGSIPDSAAEGFFGRRLSNQPPLRTSTLSTLGTGIPPPPLSPFEPLSESPRATSPPPDRDDDLDSSAPRNVAQDMISVSTVGAGPSVQLVERMSAAIRRLEAEKVAAKEEMARVCGQRDEARTDMVGLMKDLEAAKSATTRVTQLEVEVDNINSRYQTTLEMLGEKSELVEELRADVQDVKAMYRELVERTVT
ncbi:hypothetical protein G7Z17_g10785 [Cylindrodendrum hubeiense]|uniref:TATA element modulatory factor 1 TATA binding domain-containing protein n=1 Tax=Cylindrodendrum hubeiense TaxID=595255 RepID=A0A9P5H0V3_9HYPO|nr:hypothetical protein G7Z17_g10785 [Cylindrodendrum hubeiense]